MSRPTFPAWASPRNHEIDLGRMKASFLTPFDPKVALISGAPDNVSIEILLRPFILENTVVDPSIRLDRIALSTRSADISTAQYISPAHIIQSTSLRSPSIVHVTAMQVLL
jgi:hypothetical protein